MRLTIFTEYGLHALVLVARNQGVPVGARHIAEGIGLPLNHLVKIVQRLRQAGYLETTRGRIGGTRLAQPAEVIMVGEVVRSLERAFNLVDCIQADGCCALANASDCRATLRHALMAYLAVLDRYSIADLME